VDVMTTNQPKIIGIVNITEDSFSDGGLYLDPGEALAHARALSADGADVIELGPASSHPDAAPVTAEEQCRRLAPVIEQLTADGVRVSVDSFLPETQGFALARGAMYLNDIQGFSDPSQYAHLAAADCHLIVMHSVQLRGPATLVSTDPTAIVGRIERFLADRLDALTTAGIPQGRLIIDPGLGYFLGRNPEPSLVAMGALRRLKAKFRVPVLVSPSRKSFLRNITGRAIADVGAASLGAELYAASQGVDYIRTHDVAALRDALAVHSAIAVASGSSARSVSP
jgi:dihydropteroate synthase type 2